LLNRELPVLPQVREAAGRVAQPVAEMAVEQTPGLAIAQKIGERVPYYPTPEGLMVGGVEGLVPTRVWEVALELLPGIGTVPGVMSAVRKGNPEAIAAVRRALKDPRAADAIAGARRALQAESEGQGVRYAGRKAGTEQEAREAAKLRAFHQRALAQENERRAQAGEKLPPDARRAPLSGSQLTDEQLARRVQVNLAQAAGRQLLEDPYAAPLNTVLKAYDTDFSKRSIINHVPAEQRTNPQILVRYAKILKRIGREAEALDLVAAAIQADEALTTQLLSAE